MLAIEDKIGVRYTSRDHVAVNPLYRSRRQFARLDGSEEALGSAARS